MENPHSTSSSAGKMKKKDSKHKDEPERGGTQHDGRAKSNASLTRGSQPWVDHGLSALPPRLAHKVAPTEDGVLHSGALRMSASEASVHHAADRIVVEAAAGGEGTLPGGARVDLALKNREEMHPRFYRSDGSTSRYYIFRTATGRFCVGDCAYRCDPCQEGIASDLSRFGAGLSGYFKLLKALALMAFGSFLIVLPTVFLAFSAARAREEPAGAAVVVAEGTIGDGGDTTPQTIQGLLASTSLGAFAEEYVDDCGVWRTRPSQGVELGGSAALSGAGLAWFVSIMDVLVTLFLLAAGIWIRGAIAREHNDTHRSTITIDEFSVELPWVPPETTEEELIEYMERVAVARPRSVTLAHDMGQLSTIAKKRGEKLAKAEATSALLGSKLREHGVSPAEISRALAEGHDSGSDTDTYNSDSQNSGSSSEEDDSDHSSHQQHDRSSRDSSTKHIKHLDLNNIPQQQDDTHDQKPSPRQKPHKPDLDPKKKKKRKRKRTKTDPSKVEPVNAIIPIATTPRRNVLELETSRDAVDISHPTRKKRPSVSGSGALEDDEEAFQQKISRSPRLRKHRRRTASVQMRSRSQSKERPPSFRSSSQSKDRASPRRQSSSHSKQSSQGVPHLPRARISRTHSHASSPDSRLDVTTSRSQMLPVIEPSASEPSMVDKKVITPRSARHRRRSRSSSGSFHPASKDSPSKALVKSPKVKPGSPMHVERSSSRHSSAHRSGTIEALVDNMSFAVREELLDVLSQRRKYLKEARELRLSALAHGTFKGAVRAFITFERQEHAETARKKLGGNWSYRLVRRVFESTEDRFLGKYVLYCREPPLPSAVLWHNLALRPHHVCFRRSLSAAIAVGLLLVSVVAIVLSASSVETGTGEPTVQVAEARPGAVCEEDVEKADGSDSSFALLLLTPFVINVVNVLMDFVLRAFANYEGHPSTTDRDSAVLSGLVIRRFLNTAVIPILLNIPRTVVATIGLSWLWASRKGFSDVTAAWYGEVGVSILLTMAFNIVTPLAAPTARYLQYLFVQYGTLWGFFGPVSQRQLDEAFLGPHFRLSDRVADVLSTVLVTVILSPGLPLLFLFSAVGFIILFWTDLFRFLSICRTPPWTDTRVLVTFSRVLPFALCARLAFSTWVLTAGSLESSQVFNAVEVASSLQGTSGTETSPLSRFIARVFQAHAIPHLVLFTIYFLFGIIMSGWETIGAISEMICPQRITLDERDRVRRRHGHDRTIVAVDARSRAARDMYDNLPLSEIIFQSHVVSDLKEYDPKTHPLYRDALREGHEV